VADALKTGMLHSAEVIGAVCDEIAARAKGTPLVADPVMVAKGGHPLWPRMRWRRGSAA